MHDPVLSERRVQIKVIDVFVLQGCSRCLAGLEDAVSWNERNLLANIDQAVELGILSAPAIAIDGKLVFSSLPTPEQLRAVMASAAPEV
mgnify:FL=1